MHENGIVIASFFFFFASHIHSLVPVISSNYLFSHTFVLCRNQCKCILFCYLLGTDVY